MPRAAHAPQLTPLVELSQALAASDIRTALPRVLELLADAFGASSASGCLMPTAKHASPAPLQPSTLFA